MCRIHTGILMRTLVLGVILLTLISCWILIHHTSNNLVEKKQRVLKTLSFPSARMNFLARQTVFGENGKTLNDADEKRTTTRAKVLLISARSSISFHKSMTSVLEANRFEYQLVYFNDFYSIQTFSDNDVGKFSVIVFERVQFYTNMEKEKRNQLHEYCKHYGVGIVLFTEHEQRAVVDLKFFHLRIYIGVSNLENVELNPSCSLLRLTKYGGVLEGALPGSKWSVFVSNHSAYEIVEFASKVKILANQAGHIQLENTIRVNKKLATVVNDRGLLDGIHRVYFGSSFQLWLHKLLFLDVLTALSRGRHARPLDRWLLVDIDDIFVGKKGTRMTRDDVKVSF